MYKLNLHVQRMNMCNKWPAASTKQTQATRGCSQVKQCLCKGKLPVCSMARTSNLRPCLRLHQEPAWCPSNLGSVPIGHVCAICVPTHSLLLPFLLHIALHKPLTHTSLASGLFLGNPVVFLNVSFINRASHLLLQ